MVFLCRAVSHDSDILGELPYVHLVERVIADGAGSAGDERHHALLTGDPGSTHLGMIVAQEFAEELPVVILPRHP
jgi:hypothetical protein